MLKADSNYPVPSIQKATGFQEYLSETLKTFKRVLPGPIFLEKLKDIGITSRLSYSKLISGKRKLSFDKTTQLAEALDMSLLERNALYDLYAKQTKTCSATGVQDRIVNPHVLSHPLNTIVLNMCSLSKKVDDTLICQSLSHIFTSTEIMHAIALLLENDLIFKDDGGFYRRKTEKILSTLPGVKADYARRYIARSLDLAEKCYDLDLSEREYTSFSVKVCREDMPKLKDLIRDFRTSACGISTQNTDTVVQINVNAFQITQL